MTTTARITEGTETDFPPLSSLEWKVVSLAMREANGVECDTGGSGWLGRFFRKASGLRPTLPLADPRLEALRRFTCRVRDHGDASDLGPQLLELGFHPGQIRAVTMLAR